MKRYFAILVALLLPFSVLAQTTTPTADSLEIRQRNPANNGIITYYVVPDGAVDQLMTYAGSTNGPIYLKLGAGLSRSTTTLTISPAANQISDSTSVGRAVLTATDAAAARTAIGAASSGSSFDGQYSSLTGIPSTFAPAAHNQPWSTITSTPTTLAGFGISDGATSSALTSGLAGKFNTPTGTTAQYLRGDGSLATFPTLTSGTVTSITAGAGLSGGTITTSGTISMPNTGTAGTYSGVTTDAQGRVTAGTVRSYTYQTRALNTCFQVSAARDAMVSYSVDILTSLSLTSGQQGTVYLRTYTNSGCTTGEQELTRFVNGQTGTLTIGLALSQNVTGTLSGVVPAGLYVQLVTQNNTGTPTFTARPGQEVLM